MNCDVYNCFNYDFCIAIENGNNELFEEDYDSLPLCYGFLSIEQYLQLAEYQHNKLF